MTPDPDPALRTPRTPRLTVDVCDAKGRPASARAPGLAKWLAAAAPAKIRGTVTIALVNNPKMRALNLAYRGKDYATDVLSFPAADTPHPDPLPVGGEREKGGEPGLRPAPGGKDSAALRLRSTPDREGNWASRIRAAAGERDGVELRAAAEWAKSRASARAKKSAEGGEAPPPQKSFPSPAGRGVRGEGRQLGDIVIATGVAARQAKEAGHSLRTELRVLALHGLLHLLGYDHEHDRGEMARVERRLRRRGGLREGLIERAV